MTESRQELVAWINELLLLDITKVEQCGTGAIYCQIYDSIFRDVPMSKVRFDVNAEYQYLNNYKVLQGTFSKHKVDRPLEAEKMAKCRLQDNLEFLQWTRRYWDAHYDGTPYDPIARRKSQSVGKPAGTSIGSSGRGSTAGSGHGAISTSRTTSSTGTRAPPAVKSSAAPRISTAPRASLAGGGVSTASRSTVNQLNEKINTLSSENEGLLEANEIIESERDFYFEKLRDVEILIQAAADNLDDNGAEKEKEEEGEDSLAEGVEKLSINEKFSQLVREIQTILYSTAEGFEIPQEGEQGEEEF